MTEKKRVVGYVLRKFPVLSETFVLNEILALEARGVEVHVFSLAPTRDPRFHESLARLEATIHYVPGPLEARTLLRYARRLARRKPRRFRRSLGRIVLAGRPKLLWRLLQAAWVAERARRVGVTHLHAHFASHPATVARLAGRLIGVPYSFTAHAFDIYRGADPRVLAGKMADARFTVTVSDFNVSFLRSLVAGRPARIELVRNGIDMERFTPPPAPPAGPFTILAVSRLVEKKGLDLLVEACRMLRERGLDFRCEIVGSGALRADLERRVRAGGLERHVRLSGALPQREVLERFRRAHVLALPCLVGRDGNRDGLPVSIVEALACGLPVVSTPVTGIPEAVRDGVNGLLVPSGDAAALAAALARLIEDDALLAHLRSGARPSVLEDFDQRRTAARLHAILTEAA